MMLSRRFLMLLGVLLCIWNSEIHRIHVFFTFDQAEGEVTDYLSGRSRKSGSLLYPLAEFVVGDTIYTAKGEANSGNDKGDKVMILYHSTNPSDCYIFDFANFWGPPLLYTLFPLMLISAFIFGSMKEDDRLLVPGFRVVTIETEESPTIDEPDDTSRITFPDSSEKFKIVFGWMQLLLIPYLAILPLAVVTWFSVEDLWNIYSPVSLLLMGALAGIYQIRFAKLN